MTYPAEIAIALASAHFTRGLAWQATPPDLCGCAVEHLTGRMRLDLELSGNALVVVREPKQHDIFAFLWRLHPAYGVAKQPQFLRAPENLRRAFGSDRIARAYARLRRHVATLDVATAATELTTYRTGVFRDRAALIVTREAGEGGERSTVRLLPPPMAHWADDLVAFFCTRFYGWRPAEVLDAPLVQLYQLRRAWAIAHGVEVIDEAKEIAADFARRTLAEHSAAVRGAAAERN